MKFVAGDFDARLGGEAVGEQVAAGKRLGIGAARISPNCRARAPVLRVVGIDADED